MPVKIKQKQTKKIQSVTYHEYFHNVNKDLYETLAITDIYELYNSISGKELWQATLEKDEAFKALNKHPEIFRIEYSDKNTKPKIRPSKKDIYEINLNDLSIIQANRANQLRDAGLLDDRPINTPIATEKNIHIKTTNKGTASKSIWKNEAMLYFVYPLLVLLIGTIILKILNII